MANVKKHRGTIGILTGGGDVPGLNPAIRAVTVRAIREGYRVLGIRRGWAGLIEIDRDLKNGSDHVMDLTEEVVNKVGRTGGTFFTARGRGRRTFLKPFFPTTCATPTPTRSTISRRR